MAKASAAGPGFAASTESVASDPTAPALNFRLSLVFSFSETALDSRPAIKPVQPDTRNGAEGLTALLHKPGRSIYLMRRIPDKKKNLRRKLEVMRGLKVRLGVFAQGLEHLCPSLF